VGNVVYKLAVFLEKVAIHSDFKAPPDERAATDVLRRSRDPTRDWLWAAAWSGPSLEERPPALPKRLRPAPHKCGEGADRSQDCEQDHDIANACQDRILRCVFRLLVDAASVLEAETKHNG
jgi:hypothetical protein